MNTGPVGGAEGDNPAAAADNPAAAADAEQHALQKIEGLRSRAVAAAASYAWPTAAAAGALLVAWLLRRRARRAR